jgi:cation diffusion facilitator CzcD-associated flavoprotein CzcO
MDCEVAVIGAGPYGLAAVAHLKSKGIEVRMFGRPMEFWADKMPAGMLLRSPRVASNISDPKGAFSSKRSSSGENRPPGPIATRDLRGLRTVVSNSGSPTSINAK